MSDVLKIIIGLVTNVAGSLMPALAYAEWDILNNYAGSWLLPAMISISGIVFMVIGTNIENKAIFVIKARSKDHARTINEQLKVISNAYMAL